MDEAQEKKRKSDIWASYRQEGNKVFCIHCDKEFKDSTSTSSLRYHFSKKHNNTAPMNEQPVSFSQPVAERLLARCVAENALSFRLVESSSFIDLLHHLNHDFDVPTRQRLSRILLPNLEREVREKVHESISLLRDFSLTLDGWTSLGSDVYLAITLHGITRRWKLVSHLLELIPFNKDETGRLIANAVEECLRR